MRFPVIGTRGGQQLCKLTGLAVVAAGADSKGVVSIEALLEENFKQKELREKRRREKEEKERHRREALSVKKEQLMKTKGCATAV